MALLWFCGGTSGICEDKKPEVLVHVAPVYPESLIETGNSGEVLVEFVVDMYGRILNPVVLKSSHPAFEEPAIASLLQWKFKPGLKNGKPVSCRVIQQIVFTLSGPELDNVDPFAVSPQASKKLPEIYRYDTPPKPALVVAPVYPYDLFMQEKTGSATIAYMVDEHGIAHVIKVAKSTHPDFAKAATAMVEAQLFEPAKKKDGQPSRALLTQQVDFDRAGRDAPLLAATLRLERLIKKTPDAICVLKQLDGFPFPKFRPAPAYPRALMAENLSGEAVIEFIIDREGKAQLPRVVSATREEFGWAAATAVLRWRFEPPLKGGNPSMCAPAFRLSSRRRRRRPGCR